MQGFCETTEKTSLKADLERSPVQVLFVFFFFQVDHDILMYILLWYNNEEFLRTKKKCLSCSHCLLYPLFDNSSLLLGKGQELAK
jgi:hypothetical protein